MIQYHLSMSFIDPYACLETDFHVLLYSYSSVQQVCPSFSAIRAGYTSLSGTFHFTSYTICPFPPPVTSDVTPSFP